tara:strand:- start:701 stop:1417 length:717 start_codon:yes stop_codon:yes gene_type:complete
MKKLCLLLIITSLSFNVFSQDIILKRSGDQIKAKVIEVSDEYIKYKKNGFENGPDFKMSVSEIFMLTFENGEKMMFEEANTKEKKSDSNVAMLLGGTSVPLRMNETISSDKKGGRKVSTGEVITLTVHQDISDMDGNVLIKQGTQVNGTITNSVKRKAAGTKGKLSFMVSSIRAADNQSVPVNFKYEFAGKSKTGVAVAAGAVIAAPLLLIKGKPAIVEAGTIFQALVSTDRKINLNK